MNVRKIMKKPLLREGATLLGLYWLYSSIRWFVARESPYEAFHNAYQVINLEMRLGIFHEPSIQKWLINHAIGLVKFANSFYTFGYFPVLILTGLMLYRFFPARFEVFKLTFLLGLGFALIGFSLFPLAPPRMLPEMGFKDTQQLFSDGFYNRKVVLSFYNPYAAMPSLHFGWALLVGIAVFTCFEHRVLKGMAVLYPLTMALVIVTTGHHYFLDIASGGVVVGSAYGLASTVPNMIRAGTLVPAGPRSRLIYKNETGAVSPRYRVRRPPSRWSQAKQDKLQRRKRQTTLAALMTNRRPPV